MKKLLKIIGIVIIVLLGLGIYMLMKYNADFAPYTYKTFDTVYDIKSDIYNLAESKKEITAIAQKYEKEIKLTHIEYNLSKINDGIAKFQFYTDDFNGKNKVCVLNITVNLQTNKTTKITYEKGHGKRVSGYSNEIVNKLNDNILNYINETDENIKITVTNFGINKLKNQ